MKGLVRSTPVFLAAGLVVACARGLTPPRIEASATPRSSNTIAVQALECVASVAERSVSCSKPQGESGRAYAALAARNVSYDPSTSELRFDVSVKNLIPQALGTSDGTTGSRDGVRFAITRLPEATGGKGVTVANADGVDSFTAANQQYFGYTASTLGADDVLSTNESSSDKSWILNVPSGVTSFSFTTLVSSDVRYPEGYLDITPAGKRVTAGDAVQMRAVARNAFGVEEPTTGPLTWSGSDPWVATVDARTGSLTAVAAGDVSVSAKMGRSTRTGSATLSICASESRASAVTLVSTTCAAPTTGSLHAYLPVHVFIATAAALAERDAANVDEALATDDGVSTIEGEAQRLRWYPSGPSARPANGRYGAMAFADDSAFAVSKAGVSLMRLNIDGSLVVRGTAGSGSIPATGSGVRMMWFPSQYAFRAGKVESFGATYWDLSNVGTGSIGLGENVRASGNNSFAANLATTASGDESVALGNNGTASADRAFAFNGTASGVGAVAIGSGAQATSDDALAMGPSSIAGGLASIVIGPSIANGSFGVAIGLQNSASGNFSVAIGKNARTSNRQGSIVLGDGCAGFSSDSVYPTANNQFIARGCGGVKIFTNQGLTSGVELASGGSSWSAVSDRNRKENFSSVDGEELLRRLRGVPVTTWNYKSQETRYRHMGPMAQDFFAAFSLGESNLLINSLDIDGVSLAGVKALDARTVTQAERIDALERANVDLRKQNADLAARLERLETLLLQIRK